MPFKSSFQEWLSSLAKYLCQEDISGGIAMDRACAHSVRGAEFN